MAKKTQAILFIVASLAIALLWFGVREATKQRQDAAEREVAEREAGEAGTRRPAPARPTQVLGDADTPRLKLCGRISNYDPAQGPGFVTVSVALPGTAHPVQTAKISPDGEWELNLVPGAPLNVAVTIPGSLASNRRIAKPLPCSREVYELELASGPATTIEGTVSDAFGGPIASADIDVIPQGHQNGFGFEQPVFRTISNEAGEFSITVPPNEYVVRSAFPGYSSATAGADTTLRALEKVALVLSPGASVSGRVVLAGSGEGVANAELRLVALSDAGSSFVNYAGRADAISGPDGAFRIDNVGFGSWAIYAKSGEAVSSAPTEVSINIYEDVQDVVVTVDAGTAVYGVVRERGTEVPIADALVVLKGDALAMTCSASDSEGLFDCGAVPRGSYNAIVSHKQYAGSLLGATVSVGAEQRFIELELEQGYTVEGRVSPAVAGVPIRVRMAVESIDMSSMGYTMMNAFSTAKTDADGRFRIGPLALGEVALIAEHLEHGRGEALVDRALAEAGSEVQITLSPAGTLVGQVTGLGETDGSSLELVLAPIDEPKRIDGIRSAGAAMYTVAIEASGAFEAKGLEAGSYTMKLRHSLGAVSFEGPTQVELQDGQLTRVELELAAQQQRFFGVVVDEDGGLVEGAVVYLAKDRSSRALSDSSGEFTLVAWSDAIALPVRYHRAGYSTAASDATLRAGESNQLVVPPESNLEITHPGVESGSLVITGKTRLVRPISRAGVTSIAGLLAGSYQVHVCGDDAYGHGQIELGERETKLTVDASPWIQATGVAIGPDGEPLSGAQVYAVPARDPCGVFSRAAMASFAGGSLLTGDDGSFTVAGLPPGSVVLYFVDARTDPPRELMTTVAIEAGNERYDLGDVQL